MSKELLSFNNIMRVVCKYYGVKKGEVLTVQRQQELVGARHMFCNMCRSHTSSTTSDIGRYIGRDHSTVVFGARKIDILAEFDKDIREDRDIIASTILNGHIKAPSCKDIVDIDWNKGTITFMRKGVETKERIIRFLNKNHSKVAVLKNKKHD